jgi:hypothetical protein
MPFPEIFLFPTEIDEKIICLKGRKTTGDFIQKSQN